MYKEEFLDFISGSLCNYFAVLNIEDILLENGFIKLEEDEEFDLKENKNYYVIRSDSSIIAFKMPKNIDKLKIVLSHTDSPTFKLKENMVKRGSGEYNLLNVEVYGGPILSSWLDRPVSICGRVFYQEKGVVKRGFYDLEKALIISNTPPHLNKELNNGFKYNPAVDLMPFIPADFDLEEDIASKLNIKKDQILSRDLFLYNMEEPRLGGVNDELLYSSQIDNLECAYATLKGFLKAFDDDSVLIYGALDNEEVGSLSTNGASSTFLKDIVKRILNNKTKEEQKQILARSFTISADNAHAMHPNHPELFDRDNAPRMGGGIVIKENAGLSYTTSGLTKALFKYVLDKNNIKYQFYANRSDIRGGSTLGRLSLEQLSINSIDIGLAQLAMHSSYEVADAFDLEEMIKAIEAFFNQKYILEKGEYKFYD